MAVEPPQGLAHDIDRHDAGEDRMPFAQASRERREQPFGGHVQFVTQIFRRRFEFGEIIAVGLDQIAHALDRIGLKPRALVAVGHLGGDHGFAAAGFGIGRVEPLQGVRDAGAEFGEVAQFLLRQVDLAEQWI